MPCSENGNLAKIAISNNSSENRLVKGTGAKKEKEENGRKMKKVIALSCAAAMVLSTFPVSADEAVNEDVSGSITVWEHAYSFEEALKAVIEGFKSKISQRGSGLRD